MAKALLIAEKPSLMRAILDVYSRHKNEFPFDVTFMAQAGHLIGLKLPSEIDSKYGKWSLSAYPEIYPYVYRINDKKDELVRNIKKEVKSGEYDFVIHAGDPDQEGELLVRETLDYIGSKLPVKRFWSNDLSEGAILGALKNLQDDANYDHIYEAALARQHSDYQFGMNCTGALTCKTGELCKIGRVKAGIVAVIAQRELEIQNYVEKKTYKPAFLYKDCEFVFDKVFENPEMALEVVPKTEYADIISAKYDEKQHKAPALFKLATLQTEAHKVFGWDPKKTLAVAQDLYEAKATSYPRTTCEYISSQVNIGNIAKKVLAEIAIPTDMLVREPSDVIKDKTYANDKAIASEGHTAIIPTGQGLPAKSTDDEKKLYELICKRFLAIFGRPKVVMNVNVVANPSGVKDNYVFTESYDIDPGFELILNNNYKIKDGCGIEFKQGMNLHPIEFFAKEIVSKKPSRYNGGSLIKYLDKLTYETENGKIEYSIGTPATRASIIDECQSNGYFSVEKGSYVASEKALAIYEAFKEVPLFNPIESGKWESLFDEIRKGKQDYKDIEESLIDKMKTSVEMIKDGSIAKFSSKTAGKKGSSTVGECPNCKAIIKTGQYGVYCSGKCGMTFGKVRGKELTSTQWQDILKGKTVHLKGLVSQKNTKYNAAITPKDLVDYSYIKKDGTKVNGKEYEFDIQLER